MGHKYVITIIIYAHNYKYELLTLVSHHSFASTMLPYWAHMVGSKLQALFYDILPSRCRKAVLGVWVGWSVVLLRSCFSTADPFNSVFTTVVHNC